jgi:hypothetical protein
VLASESESSKTIEFTDNDLETSAVIRLFLETITRYRLPGGKHIETPRLVAFASFLMKWDCDGVLQLLLLQLRAWLLQGSKETNAWGVWTVGAVAGDIDVCTIALSRHDHKWGRQSTDDPNYHKSKAIAFDPTGWGISIWRSGIPPEYLCALSRAFGDVGATDKLAGAFKAHLEKLIKKSEAGGGGEVTSGAGGSDQSAG